MSMGQEKHQISYNCYSATVGMDGCAVCGHFCDGGNNAWCAKPSLCGMAYGWITRESVADTH